MRIFASTGVPRVGECFIIYTTLGRKLIKVTRVENASSRIFRFRKLRASSKKWTHEEVGLFFGRAGTTEIRKPTDDDRDLLRIAKVATTPEGERLAAEGMDGRRIEDCPAENRVRVFFPGAGKPAAEVRALLKSRGFRWVSTIGCWQAHRNPSSLETARSVVGEVTSGAA